MEATFAVLESLGIPFEARITSAHRTPETTKEFVVDAEARVYRRSGHGGSPGGCRFGNYG
jgi:phosphoribosylcarboxyaminoimidazole (NCAIR) mutase